MGRNPLNCPHNVTETDPDTGEEFCIECGIVLEDEEEDDDF